MTQEFIAFKVIAKSAELTFNDFNAYTDPSYQGNERTILERTDNIADLREKAHGCFKLKLKDKHSYMLSPREAEKVIETLTHNYKR